MEVLFKRGLYSQKHDLLSTLGFGFTLLIKLAFYTFYGYDRRHKTQSQR